MKEILEKPNLEETIEKKPLYDLGEVVGYLESTFNKSGLLIKERWTDEKGQETESVEYKYDDKGRESAKIWRKNGEITGREVPIRTKTGKQWTTVWERFENGRFIKAEIPEYTPDE